MTSHKSGYSKSNLTDLNTTDDDANRDLFADGILEDFEERYLTPETYSNYPEELNNLLSVYVPKRKNPIKIVIVKKRREFALPTNFYDKEPGVEGNIEVKPAPKAHECPIGPRSILEIGFQTEFSTSEHYRNNKDFQVVKTKVKNNFSQVFEQNTDIKPIYEDRAQELRSDKKDSHGIPYLKKIETFIELVRPKIEEALQSNETIDIFQNDFHLDKNEDLSQEKTDKPPESEIRVFRDNFLAGQKSKKEKNINQVKQVHSSVEFIAHTYMRNLSFEDRIKVSGIYYTEHILFWNIKNLEINAPIFSIDVPMEVTCFEFHPINPNIIVIALLTGQLLILEFQKLLWILENVHDTEYSEQIAKTNKNEFYTFLQTSIAESHKTHITSMKWFPPGYIYHKYNLLQTEKTDVNLLGTVAEDGQVFIWDILNLDRTVINNTNDHIRPVLKVEVNKLDSLFKINGTSLEIRLIHDSMIYVGTDEGQVYAIDWKEKNSSENLTNNIKKCYNTCYYRPIISLEFSSFFPNIFLIVMDFNFSIWNTSYKKPILESPNLKSFYYVSGKFSKSRPGVFFLARCNGQIDIWDLLDESHKPSVKETFLKECITFLDIIYYRPIVDDKPQDTQEFLCVGDQAGTLTLMMVPKLFNEKIPDEEIIVKKFFENELERQQYMEQRYKLLSEEISKPPDEIEQLLNNKKKQKDEDTKEDTEFKYLEEEYLVERQRMIEEYGFSLEQESENIEAEDDTYLIR